MRRSDWSVSRICGPGYDCRTRIRGSLTLRRSRLERRSLRTSRRQIPAFEGEEERGSLVDLGRRPDPSAVVADDARHDRQPDARALVLVIAVQPAEGLEQLAGGRGVEPGAGVADVHRAVLVAHPDLRVGMLGGVLPRIAE